MYISTFTDQYSTKTLAKPSVQLDIYLFYEESKPCNEDNKKQNAYTKELCTCEFAENNFHTNKINGYKIPSCYTLKSKIKHF